MTSPGQHHLAELAHTVVSTASSGTSFTDYLTGWGTIGLAVATFAAVIVALRQAGAERRRAEAERERHWQAQARLVLTDVPGTQPQTDRVRRGLVFRIQNHGEQPIMNVYAEAWEGAAALDQETPLRLIGRVLLPGPQDRWVLHVPGPPGGPAPTLRAWRYRWTDADGRQWCVDQPQQWQPLPFTGQPPRPYTGSSPPAEASGEPLTRRYLRCLRLRRGR